MTPDKRLDQVESLLAETMAILDRHTAQLTQHTRLLLNLTQVASQQSDNIEFLLSELGEVKSGQAAIHTDIGALRADVQGVQNEIYEIRASLTGVRTGQTGLQQDIVELRTGQTSLQQDVAELRTGQTGMDGKLDLILEKLSK